MRRCHIAKLLWLLDVCVCAALVILTATETIPLPMWAMWVIVAAATLLTLVGTYFLSRCPHCRMPLNAFRIARYTACPYCGNELDDKEQ